jgi:hypothetical protein
LERLGHRRVLSGHLGVIPREVYHTGRDSTSTIHQDAKENAGFLLRGGGERVAQAVTLLLIVYQDHLAR